MLTGNELRRRLPSSSWFSQWISTFFGLKNIRKQTKSLKLFSWNYLYHPKRERWQVYCHRQKKRSANLHIWWARIRRSLPQNTPQLNYETWYRCWLINSRWEQPNNGFSSCSRLPPTPSNFLTAALPQRRFSFYELNSPPSKYKQVNSASKWKANTIFSAMSKLSTLSSQILPEDVEQRLAPPCLSNMNYKKNPIKPPPCPLKQLPAASVSTSHPSSAPVPPSLSGSRCSASWPIGGRVSHCIQAGLRREREGVRAKEGWEKTEREVGEREWTLTCSLCPPDQNAGWSWWGSSVRAPGPWSPTRTAGRAGRRRDSPGRSGSPRCGSLYSLHIYLRRRTTTTTKKGKKVGGVSGGKLIVWQIKVHQQEMEGV